jgi:NNP family nitrate/nitrite transporter-like MFS transporter
MPAIEQDLGLSHSQAGSLFLFASAGFFVAQVCSGLVASRFNHRGALIISALAIGVALVPFLFTHSLGTTRALMIMLGLATGLHMPSAMATITAMVSRQDWGKALGVHQTAPSVALVLAPLVSVGLLGVLSWQTILSSVGAVSLAAGVAFIFFGRCGEFPGEAPRPGVVKIILVQPSFWIMVALFSLAMGGGAGIYTMLPLYLVSERGFDPDWANTLLGLSRISGLFMTFVAGWITDRLGEKRAIAGALFMSGISTMLIGFAPDPWLVTVFFLQPAMTTCFFPPALSALSRIVPPYLRSVTSSLTTPLAFLVGGGVVPAFIGHMGETRTFALGIGLVGCVMVLAPFLAIFLKLREKVEEGC